MARNKYPEQTVKKIIETALQLFLEKGYERTTIQDIVDRLGGLSKGAIYHHFKSKEEILSAVSDHIFSQDDSGGWGTIRDDPTMNAIEKIRRMLLTTFTDPQEKAFRDFGVIQANTPRFLVDRLKRSVEENARYYFSPVIEQGVREGTIQTAFPKELAEVLMLLLNIWLDPSTFPATKAELLRKVFFLLDLCEKYGLSDVMNEELAQAFGNGYESYVQNINAQQEQSRIPSHY